jgi:hypothetical protein
MWENFSFIEFDPRCRSGFLGDGQFIYIPIPAADVKIDVVEEPLEPKKELLYEDRGHGGAARVPGTSCGCSFSFYFVNGFPLYFILAKVPVRCIGKNKYSNE